MIQRTLDISDEFLLMLFKGQGEKPIKIDCPIPPDARLVNMWMTNQQTLHLTLESDLWSEEEATMPMVIRFQNVEPDEELQ